MSHGSSQKNVIKSDQQQQQQQQPGRERPKKATKSPFSPLVQYTSAGWPFHSHRLAPTPGIRHMHPSWRNREKGDPKEKRKGSLSIATHFSFSFFWNSTQNARRMEEASLIGSFATVVVVVRLCESCSAPFACLDLAPMERAGYGGCSSNHHQKGESTHPKTREGDPFLPASAFLASHHHLSLSLSQHPEEESENGQCPSL